MQHMGQRFVSGRHTNPGLLCRAGSVKMAAANDCPEPGKLYKEVITLDGVRTVLSKILPQRKINKHVIVVIPGNPGLIEFYDDFVTSLFDALQGQLPVFGISHTGW